jgi:hypothetical protein
MNPIISKKLLITRRNKNKFAFYIKSAIMLMNKYSNTLGGTGVATSSVKPRVRLSATQKCMALFRRLIGL